MEIIEPKIHSGYIEVAVALLLDYRRYTIVPNVHWGAGFSHECDMLAIDGDNKMTEIEVKISMADLKADFKKKHGHSSKYISRLVYAMPEKMITKAVEIIPKEHGIISVKWNGYRFEAKWVRKARHRKHYIEQVPQSKIINIMRLGCMRIWSLKTKLYGRK